MFGIQYCRLQRRQKVNKVKKVKNRQKVKNKLFSTKQDYLFTEYTEDQFRTKVMHHMDRGTQKKIGVSDMVV